MRRFSAPTLGSVTLILFIGLGLAGAQGVREHTRLTPNRSTTVSEEQATELTLTVTAAAVQPVYIWIRTAGVIDPSKRVVTASLSPADAAVVRAGQRVRAFSPESRSRMYQATVSRVARQGDRTEITATLNGQALETSTHYVLEIVAEGGDLLAVPNEAIIETGGTQVVYVQQAGGRYAPREIKTGLRGELFTQVIEGLTAGEQVVTIGSFFIDAEHKLKN
jgi:Cu(I)/Ag(I) efflux system membrane fusion protein